MFFFFAGGVEQQAGRVLKEAAGLCFRCGSVADLVETEKVLMLFFVPVYRWPSRDPAFLCRECSLLFPRSTFPLPPRFPPTCHSCSREVDPAFRFCPFCGTAL